MTNFFNRLKNCLAGWSGKHVACEPAFEPSRAQQNLAWLPRNRVFEPLDLPLPDYPAPGLIGEPLYLRYSAFMAQAGKNPAPLADGALREVGRRLASELLGQAITLGSSKAHEGSDEVYWLVQSAAITSLFADGAQSAEFAGYRQHVAYYQAGCRTAGQVNAFDRYVAANGQPAVEDEVQSRSADDHYRVMVRPWEAGNTHWVYSPRVLDTHQGTCLLSFQDACWSADVSTWHSGSTVELALRKYPSHRARDGIRVIIDCTKRCALLEAGGEIELADLEAVLDARLEGAEPGSR